MHRSLQRPNISQLDKYNNKFARILADEQSLPDRSQVRYLYVEGLRPYEL